jgi:hypothetical protein
MIIDAGGDWESDMYVLSRPPSPHAAASPEAARPGRGWIRGSGSPPPAAAAGPDAARPALVSGNGRPRRGLPGRCPSATDRDRADAARTERVTFSTN